MSFAASTGSYIDAGALINITPTTSFTVSTYLKRAGANKPGPCGAENPANVVSRAHGYQGFMLNSASNGYSFVSEVSTDNSEAVSAIVADAQWHHIAAVVETGVKHTFYVDGVAVTSIPYTKSPNFFVTDHLLIGGPRNVHCGGNGVFNGTIDEVRIYNRAVSASEIAALADLMK